MVIEDDYYFSIIERDNTNFFNFNDEMFPFQKIDKDSNTT